LSCWGFGQCGELDRIPRDHAELRMRRAVLGGCAAGLATGWNVSNLGAIPSHLARSYGVSLAVVGLFTTALFLTHLAMQIPGGRASDRFGARRAGILGLAITVASNGLALIAAEPGLALGARALVGIGTGLSFVAGSAYVRESGGSPFAQGLFGGVGLGGGGVALAVVSQLDGRLGWRAPYWTALVVGAAGPAAAARGARARRSGGAAGRPPPLPAGGALRGLARPQPRRRQLGGRAARAPRRRLEANGGRGRRADARPRGRDATARRLDPARTAARDPGGGRRQPRRRRRRHRAADGRPPARA